MSGNTEEAEIYNLANILHQNGDKVLNALSKLSLNAVLLQKLNQLFEKFIDNGTDREGTFQVIIANSGNSQLLKDLHFVHDFIQKTVGLKITNNLSLHLLNNKVDISKFKSIKYLEIKKVPIKEVIGLKSVQSQLESIVCTRCLSMLEELLAGCGGDNSKGFVWSELREAVLSFNNIKVVDTSVAFAPWLQVLDLSHNQISDVKAIECLPNLKYVNLSFNCLELIPVFNKSARKKIELLVLGNNYIENLSGLNGLSHLTELDLSNNWVTSTDSLNPLLSMPALQWLSLEGNPISWKQNYRRSVAGYLHISASFCDFYLDKINLSKKEKSIVGIKLCGSDVTKTHLQKISRSSLKLKNSSNEKNPEEPTTVARKSGKGRVVVIPNLDDGTYEEEEAPNDSNMSYFMTSSTEHLITKKRIENTRSAFGIDNWLVQGSSVVQDILGLPPLEINTSTPCDDLCLQAALDLVKNVVTTKAVIETQPEPEKELAEKNNIDSFSTCKEDESSNYLSAENSEEKTLDGNNEFEENEQPDPFSKEVSPDIEKIDDVEEVEIDENEKLFVVSKEVKTFNNEVKQEELFLTITETELQEREPTRGKIVTKWSLSALESCVKLKSNQLQFVFDTVRRDKRERTYSLEEQEANILYKLIAEILESRTLSDMNQIVYKCENCSSQFSKEVKSRKPDCNMWCPFCNSKFILQLDEVPFPSYVEEKKVSGVKTSKNPESKVSHNRSSSTGGFFQSLLGQTEEKMSKYASQSSIENITSQSTEVYKSSAASLDELNELPTIQGNAAKRSDSDIEILSNPSQSSIEVIDGPGRTQSGSTPHRKRSSEERQLIAPGDFVAATNLLQGSNPVGLTESSSSGSITDSICTAYESSSTGPTVEKKAEGDKILSGDTQQYDKNSELILQDVLKKIRLEMKKSKPVDLVNYSYTNFTKFDHRIKLFLYTHVFEDTSEEFSFGLRVTVLQPNSGITFPSCIVASNKKLYFLKVTNCENGDDARNFLQKSDSLCFNLNTIKSIYTLTWYQGFGVKIQINNNKSKEFLLLLKDSERTQSFIKFLTSSDIHGLERSKIIKETLERPYLAMQHLLLSCTFLEDSNIQFFCLFDVCSVTDSNGLKEIKSGGILTNSMELLLFPGGLNWLADGSATPPNPEFSQKIKNLMQVYSGQSNLLLQFVSGEEEKEVWSITMESNYSAEALLKSLKDSWEKIFSVQLNFCTL